MGNGSQWLSSHARMVIVALLVACSGGDDRDSAEGGSTELDASAGGSSSDQSNGSTSAASSPSSVATGAAPRANLEDIAKELTVTGPITGGKGKPFSTTSADLDAAGYTEKEFFFEGPTTSYTMDGGATRDGKWKLVEATKSAFKSRLLVRRPSDEAKFNGTVIVEWLNVSGGADGDPGFMYNSDLILREGYAFVAVSAQQVGVQGGGFSLGGAGAVPLVMADPERYGSLTHPGDAYSFDIYSQAAKVIRDGQGDVLEGLKPKYVIAYGESQSAGRLVGYVNGVHVRDKVYDGFFIHSRGASGTPYSDGAATASGLGGIDISMFAGGGGAGHHIRDDIDEKVFQFQTETDVTGMLAFLPARQPDTDKLRTWEVAGTAHADQFILDFNASMAAEGSIQCPGANDGPQYQVIRAALHSLNAWIKDGTEPAIGQVLETDASGKSLRDEHGNALGGVRSPDVDVPNRTLSGDPAGAGGGSLFCFLFGSVTPFTPEKLKSLYPTHEEYVTKVKASAQKLQEAGFLLEPEVESIISEAEAADIPPK